MWSDLDQSLELLGMFVAGVVLLLVVLPRVEDDLNDRADPARTTSRSRRNAAFHAWWRHRNPRQRSGEGGDRD
ncbi:hypothetical protein GCM10023317_73130 [Actinopolymorpha pittospori]|uniref:Uncharacterized protein n=1 Tax=Actinopolymorpha pittospori TaxID=648752 RepID=A0A927N0Q9_9ACTN|nr:hypothetical protein [Actinopolymorpha pittospori]